jgi:hypothetical protein
MAYGEGSAIFKLIDQVGTAQDDVSAPEEGATIIYTTEQGLVLERAPSEGLEARQWFLDQPALLQGDGAVSLSDTPQSILDTPYTVPDDIDASYPTIYRLELQVSVENFAPDTTSIGIMVRATLSGEAYATPPVLVPCDAASGLGGTTVTFFIFAGEGNVVDVEAYTLDAADAANASATVGLIKRELRLPVLP